MDIKTNIPLDGARDAQGTRARAADRSATATAAPSAPGSAADRVTLTNQAQALLALNDAGDAVPFDTERVAALRQAIADGSYRADSARIAARLLAVESGR
jgi:negative regulator of flagellin synthesis FlgM